MATSLNPVVCIKNGGDENHKAMTLLQPLICVTEECDVRKDGGWGGGRGISHDTLWLGFTVVLRMYPSRVCYRRT